MIVHIASDEKFINNAYWQFDRIGEEEQHFYILVNDISEPLKYIELKENMSLISNSVNDLKAFVKTLEVVSLVCFHGLEYQASIVLNGLPKTQKVLWILFGTEIYSNPYLHQIRDNIGDKTFSRFLATGLIGKFKTQFKSYFRGLSYLIKEGTYSPFYEVTKALKRADFCGVLYEEEFQLVKDKLQTNIGYVKFSYYPIEKMIANVDSRVSGSGILVGNSASNTNNHLETFEILEKFDLKGRSVVTPLSYGDPEYKIAIKQEGERILGERFEPLVNFMHLHEYNAYIQKCSVVVMNHYRQQAVGNVLTMLWMGAKVYLDKRNTLYHYLKRINMHVYEIGEDLIPEKEEALKPLSELQQEHNKECLRREINQEILLLNLKKAIKTILCP